MQIEVKRFGVVSGPGSPKALRFGDTVSTCEVHKFFGLEGLPQQLVPRVPVDDAVKLVTADSQARHASQTFQAPGDESYLSRHRQRSKVISCEASKVRQQQMGFLREMSWKEDQRTVYHDLITPHRSYAFPDRSRGMSPNASNRWVGSPASGLSAQETSLLAPYMPHGVVPTNSIQPQSRGSASGIPMPVEHATVSRRRVGGESGATTMALGNGTGAHMAKRPQPQAWAVPRLKPQKTYKFKPKTMLVLSQEFYDQNSSLQNDLVGPFQNPSKINGIQYCGPQQKWHGIDRPAVRSMSTFEEYLERTVNSIRGDSQIAFHPSQTTMKKDHFKPRRNRPGHRKLPAIPGRSSSVGLDRLDFQAASMQLSMRAERSATSLGFSPAREVVDMHRLQAPWIVDPALFVRVFADAIQDEEVPPSPEEFLRFDESLKGGFRHVRGEDSDYGMPLSLISPAGSSVGNFSSALVEPSSLTSAAVYETGTLDEGDGIRA